MSMQNSAPISTPASGPAPTPQSHTAVVSKGMKTAARIMDAAEHLFAQQGFEATSLRQITRHAGITEPGLYNHFSNKRALYEAVLERALSPMSAAMDAHLQDPDSERLLDELPAIMTDILAEHPAIASLFQQALQGEQDSLGNQLIRAWLDKLLIKGSNNMEAAGISGRPNRSNMAIHIIALFNLVTGYFLSQRAFQTLAEGDIFEPSNIEKQKKLLAKIVRAMTNR